ncbi:hypothetical protein ACFE04_021040 [Oxalis oulophora]
MVVGVKGTELHNDPNSGCIVGGIGAGMLLENCRGYTFHLLLFLALCYSLWPELAGKYIEFGGAVIYRLVEDMAFAVARYSEFGGAVIYRLVEDMAFAVASDFMILYENFQLKHKVAPKKPGAIIQVPLKDFSDNLLDGEHVFVYLSYGMHMMLNIVVDHEGVEATVLICSCASDKILQQYR